MKITYEGWISEHSSGEADEILFLSKVSDPLADAVSDDMFHGRYLSVRYFISDTEVPIEELEEAEIRKIVGGGEAGLRHRYSEITGYLWTDEDLMVGGHDLLEEIRSHLGKWCHLEITFSKEAA
jgi:hypothetical protein